MLKLATAERTDLQDLLEARLDYNQKFVKAVIEKKATFSREYAILIRTCICHHWQYQRIHWPSGHAIRENGQYGGTWLVGEKYQQFQ